MGVQKKTITTVTCDICGNECGENDGDITIQVNGGDGRDLAPATIDGEIRFNQPYGVSGGIICVRCKAKWLNDYVAALYKNIDATVNHP